MGMEPGQSQKEQIHKHPSIFLGDKFIIISTKNS